MSGDPLNDEATGVLTIGTALPDGSCAYRTWELPLSECERLVASLGVPTWETVQNPAELAMSQEFVGSLEMPVMGVAQ